MESSEDEIDPSDRLDGPPLIALRGDSDPSSAYRLGTLDYDWHSHRRGLVFCVDSGLIHVRTSQGSWLMPPHRAGWMPPGIPHKISVSGAMSGWSVMTTPLASRDLPSGPCVMGIGELMRALVRRAVSWSAQDHLDPEQERVVMVLLDEIRRAPREPLHLPMPTDPRLLRIARAILDDPGDERTAEEWAAWGALSPRTLRRLMLSETGLSFTQWRQQAKLTHALEMLARGDPVAVVSDALGYATPSTFIAMFRRAFGDSPAHYFAAGGPG
ncbi:MAG: helix-turn-helix transcriptional regulator [Telmatospirillum sp.]|nr:helix-turn-helix transcriptional regulator [Telmatospirillum sp.]